MDDRLMRQKIADLLPGIEKRKRALLLAGATGALASFLSCNPPIRDAYGMPTYGADFEDAGFMDQDGGAEDAGS